jgi:hypothetical protein
MKLGFHKRLRISWVVERSLKLRRSFGWTVSVYLFVCRPSVGRRVSSPEHFTPPERISWRKCNLLCINLVTCTLCTVMKQICSYFVIWTKWRGQRVAEFNKRSRTQWKQQTRGMETSRANGRRGRRWWSWRCGRIEKDGRMRCTEEEGNLNIEIISLTSWVRFYAFFAQNINSCLTVRKF